MSARSLPAAACAPHGALSLMIQEDGPLFVADTHVNAVPTPEQIAETVCARVRHAKRFGIAPKVALCSHSNFGNLDSDSGRRMRAALEILDSREVGFDYEGEMSAMPRWTPNCAAASSRTRAFRGRRTSWSSPIPMPPTPARNMLKLRAPAGLRSADPDGHGQPAPTS